MSQLSSQSSQSVFQKIINAPISSVATTTQEVSPVLVRANSQVMPQREVTSKSMERDFLTHASREPSLGHHILNQMHV
jgi:hypothetical protein